MHDPAAKSMWDWLDALASVRAVPRACVASKLMLWAEKRGVSRNSGCRAQIVTEGVKTCFEGEVTAVAPKLIQVLTDQSATRVTGAYAHRPAKLGQGDNSGRSALLSARHKQLRKQYRRHGWETHSRRSSAEKFSAAAGTGSTAMGVTPVP
eukprot:2208442-Pleurochrysis_carterae.AAC.1